MLKQLADRWLAPVLEVRATILVLNAAQHAGAPLAHDLDRERIARADVIALHPGGKTNGDGMASLERNLAMLAPRATIAKAAFAGLDTALLDMPAREVRPHFYSGG